VVELVAKSPLDGMATVKIGTVTVSEETLGHLTTLAVYNGKDRAVSTALKAAHGMPAPGPNRATGKEGARALWFGHRMILLAGPEPDPKLASLAAMTDQSDAWVAVRLDGAEAVDVLARLTPIDLRASVFKRGHTARTDLQHMMASITRLGEASFLILCFRSFADTLVHDLRTAMEGVAAREGG
jgi:sarcosine oxidase subunit gamma